MEILAKVKASMRIAHTNLDDLFTEQISTARAEMVRAGVISDKAEATDDVLIDNAICSYVLALNAPTDQKDGYFQSWQYQLDNLRKSTGYFEESDE